MQTANDVMIHDVVTIGPNQTLSQAVDALLANEISGLPVVDGDGRLVGVISEFALLAIAYDPDSGEHPVQDHMTRDVMSISRSTSLAEIADTFIVRRIRRLPVVDKGRLVGVVSRRDILRAASHHGVLISNAVPV